MNSLKSACSFAKSTPVSFNQLEKNIEPFLRRQVSVKLIVSRLGIFKAAEHLNNSFHGLTLPRDTVSNRGSTAVSFDPPTETVPTIVKR